MQEVRRQDASGCKEKVDVPKYTAVSFEIFEKKEEDMIDES